MSDHTEIICGLLTCKPENAPTEGEIKNFVVEQRTSKTGKPWLKIKAAGPDFGGTPHRILKAEQTSRPPDQYGNIGFNVEIEATAQPNGFKQAKAAMQSPVQATERQGHTTEANQGADPAASLDARQRAIIRQHSQSMAIAVLQIKQAAGGLEQDDLTPHKLTQLANYFDHDCYSSIS